MLKNREMLKVEETNMALVGSDIEKKAKLAAAQQEPSWLNAGKTVGIEIWRIEKFNVVPWPKEQSGQFYDGDSYIVLDTHKAADDADKLAWDVHFWLGQFTTADEAGTAAYKTVELDDFLGGMPVQHRQVQGAEELSFLKLFPQNSITILEGGIESGFKHVEAGSGVSTDFTKRLFHVKGTTMRNVKSVGVPLAVSSLNEGDAFVLDAGKELYIFQGATCSPGERMNASKVATEIAENRKAAKTQVVTSDDAPAEFWAALGAEEKPESLPENGEPASKKLFKLSDATGSLEFTATTEVNKSQLNSDDVFILDAVTEVFVWVGKGASPNEKLEAMPRAQQYLNALSGRSHALPISRMVEGHERPVFLSVLGG